MASRDPNYRYQYYPGYYYHPDPDVVGGNINVTEEEHWNEMNMYCTVLAPPEFGISSVEEGKTGRKEDEELRYGEYCNSELKDKKMREKLMTTFFGPLSLEATGKEAKESTGSRVGPVMNSLGVTAAMVTIGGMLLV